MFNSLDNDYDFKLLILIIVIGTVNLISGLVLCLTSAHFSNDVLAMIYLSPVVSIFCLFIFSYIKVYTSDNLYLKLAAVILFIIAPFIGGSVLISKNNPQDKNDYNKKRIFNSFNIGILLLITSIINIYQIIGIKPIELLITHYKNIYKNRN